MDFPGHLHRRRHVAAWHLGGPEASLVLGQTLDLRRTGGEGGDGHTWLGLVSKIIYHCI